MAKKRPSATANESQQPLEALERIGDELNLIRTVLDELRADFQWAVQNGRVTIVMPEPAAPIRFHEGDGVQIHDRNGIRHGEIVEMDHAIDRAWVAVGPGNEVDSFPIESLTKKQEDSFTGHQQTQQVDSSSPNATTPIPGSLF